jgi:hypothetical protein
MAWVADLLVSLKEKIKCMGLHGLAHAPDLSFFLEVGAD